MPMSSPMIITILGLPAAACATVMDNKAVAPSSVDSTVFLMLTSTLFTPDQSRTENSLPIFCKALKAPRRLALRAEISSDSFNSTTVLPAHYDFLETDQKNPAARGT